MRELPTQALGAADLESRQGEQAPGVIVVDVTGLDGRFQRRQQLGAQADADHGRVGVELGPIG